MTILSPKLSPSFTTLRAQLMGHRARCNVGYGFVNFRTSASCDEFIARRANESCSRQVN